MNSKSCAIPKVELQFLRWEGIPIKNTLNGKPIVKFSGRPVFAELYAYELLQLSGWQARWIQVFGAAKTPRFLTTWADDLLAAQQHEPIAESWVATLLQRIADANGGTYAGCWDVVGWHKDQLIFAELKRRKKDNIRSTQLGWLEAALGLGLQPENFLLVEWEFIP